MTADTQLGMSVHVLDLFFIHWIVSFPLDRAFSGDVAMGSSLIWWFLQVVHQLHFCICVCLTPRQSPKSQGFNWTNKCLVDEVPRVF